MLIRSTPTRTSGCWSPSIVRPCGSVQPFSSSIALGCLLGRQCGAVLGKRQNQADVGTRSGPSVSPTRVRRHNRLPTLGSASQPEVPVSQALVRAAQLRHIRSAGLHPPPHPVSQALRATRPVRPEVRAVQRSEGESNSSPRSQIRTSALFTTADFFSEVANCK